MPNEPGCIAVVDDDPIMGESLQRALELEGWRAVWWHTGKKAVDGMSELCPDLVLCDIRLPDMDGEEVFRATNARSLAPPFIFMTAFGQIDQAVALVRAGAQDYLTKPFELASLFQKVREVLSLRVRDDGAQALSASRRRCAGLRRCSDGWPLDRCPFFSLGKREPERRSARGFCTQSRQPQRSRSWR